MEAELASDRKAARRELVQRAREYLNNHRGCEAFILKYLNEHGPDSDANMMLAMAELCKVQTFSDQCMKIFSTTWALWLTGILWRKEFPNHPSGEKCFIYGIRGLHPKSQ